MVTRDLTYFEIEGEFGPLLEIPPAADGGWDTSALRSAHAARLLWTRTEPGLLAAGFHFVNRESYFRATRPYAPGTDVVEVDDDIDECPACGDVTYFGRDSPCSNCEREAAE